ncbi:MAG: hypothetical protein IJC82_03670, partial [Firmicutes bacterium]|nr:hypothetical protein [Bacillota bacterium]
MMMKKQWIGLVLVLCMLFAFATPVAAADVSFDGYTYDVGTNLKPIGNVDTVIGGNYYMYAAEETSKMIPFSYEVPRNGATVLIFYSEDGCPSSQMLFESMNGAEWVYDDRIEIVAIANAGTNPYYGSRFRNTYAPMCKDEIDWNIDGTSAMWQYFYKYYDTSVSTSLAWPFVVVITEEELTVNGEKDLYPVVQFAQHTEKEAAIAGKLFDADDIGQSLDYLMPGIQSNPESIQVPAIGNVNVDVCGTENYDTAKEVFALVNSERAKEDLPALVLDKNLTACAMQRAAELAVYYDHERPDGSSIKTVFDDLNYSYDKSANYIYGENIAAGEVAASAVMKEWMGSPQHKSNIMSPNYTRVGMGCFEVEGTIYWVQLFDNGSQSTSTALETTGSKSKYATVTTKSQYLNLSMKQEISLTKGETKFVNIVHTNHAKEVYYFDCIIKPHSYNESIVLANDILTNVGTVEWSNERQGLLLTRTDDGVGEAKVYIINDPLGYTINVNEMETLDTHTHSFSQWKQVTAASCSAEGKERRYCLCGEKEYKVIPKAHKPQTVEEKPATCKEAGLTAGTKCSACDEVLSGMEVIPKSDKHTALWYFGENKTPTCQKAGEKRGMQCDECGFFQPRETLEKLPHDQNTVVPGKAATCTATGLTDGKKCSMCGTVTVEQTVIPKSGHSEVTVPGKAATCTATGLTDGKQCSVCKTVTVKQTEIPKTSHSEVKLEGKAATCTEKGLTDGKKCSVCKTVTVKQTEIKALGHSWDNGVVTTEPTETTEGVRTFTCKTCKETKTSKIPMIDKDEPANPEDPKDPVNPGDPEDPKDPAPPGDPEDPKDPVTPGDPEDPADPENPVDKPTVFDDVEEKDYYCEAVAWAYDNKITAGMTETIFGP